MGTRFRPYLLAFILSWLPFLLTWHQQGARTEEDSRKQASRWEEEALRRVDQFRTGWTYQSQLEEMGSKLSRLLERSFRKTPESRIEVTPELVSDAFFTAFPTSHRPVDARLFAVAFAASGAARALSGTGFTREKSRVVTDLLKLFAHPPALTDDEKRSLNRRCTGLFGGTSSSLYTFETFASRFRGRALPIFFGGSRFFLIWDRIEWNRRLIGAWMAIIPMEGTRTARPIPRALHRLAASCSDGTFPVMVPMVGLPDHRPILVPGKTRLPPEILAEIRAARHARAFPTLHVAGQAYQRGGFRFLREFISVHLPWELWMVAPMPPVQGTPPFLFIWGASLASLWIGIGTRVWLLGASPTLPLRRWFLGFFLLVGALPLSALAINDLELIDTLAGREQLDLRRQSARALDRLDASSAKVFRVFSTRCQQVFSSFKWRRDILEGSDQSVERAWNQAKAAFEHQGLELEVQLFYPASGTPRAFPRKQSDFSSINPRENLRFFAPFSESIYGIYNEVGKPAPPPAKATPFPGPSRMTSEAGSPSDLSSTVSMGESVRIAYNVFAGEDIGDKTLQMRRRADLIESGGEQILHFHDIISDRDKPRAHVFFRCRARPAFAAALTEAAHRGNIPNSSSADRFPENTRFILARVAPGGCEVMVPEPITRTFWESVQGRQMRQLLGLAGRSGSLQQRLSLDHLMLALPCRLTPGFLVGIVVPLRELTLGSWARIGEMLLTIILLGLPIILAALATGRSFVAPLAEMETVLGRVRAGDLQQQFFLDRNDELGDLARSFNGMIDGLRTRQKLGRFVSGSVEASLTENAVTAPEPPRERFGVVLSSDLRSFTTLSESHPARHVTAMLNRHLEVMSESIRARGGHVDSFIGDAIVALFTDDVPGPGPAGEPAVIRALRAAWDMTEAHRRLIAQRTARGQFSYQMGIGLDAGPILTGTLVAPGRLQHVLMGDPRERADVLESASRHGTFRRIVVSRRLIDLVEPLLPELQFIPLEKSREGLELVFLPDERSGT